jgi:hypothetical protein
MSVTRKHFRAFAEIAGVNEWGNGQSRYALICAFADFAAAQNPRFDYGAFHKAVEAQAAKSAEVFGKEPDPLPRY